LDTLWKGHFLRKQLRQMGWEPQQGLFTPASNMGAWATDVGKVRE